MSIRFALAGLNQVPLDWLGNMQRIRGAWHEARAAGARLICFPELVVSGYGCEDMFLAPHVARRALSLVQELARECGEEVLLLGLPFYWQDQLYNGLAVLNQGRIRAITAKSWLAKDGIHYEPRWFQPWPLGKVDSLEIEGHKIAIGTLAYAIDGLTFALEICEDAWVEDSRRPCRLIQAAQWVFNASASHFSMGKADIRERIIRESSRRFSVGYAYANLVGCESGRAIYDGELLIAYQGRILNRSTRLYLDDYRILVQDLPFEQRTPPEAAIKLRISPALQPPGLPPANSERLVPDKHLEFATAASLALFDYMRKSRSRGFVLSLSGGVDSATVAVLVYLMAQRMLNELSAQQLREKVPYYSEVHGVSELPALMSILLTCVYQATRNSGEVTRRAAEECARAVGARFLTLDVDHLVQGYTTMIGQAIGRPLTWQNDDVALQNIQARVRAPGVWLLANLGGSLLLSTSNRSEVAVGYATMDGDTCGGLSPIAGVEKTFLRRWLQVMEQQGLPGHPALPALSYINNQDPTAELRPPERAQTDEADLMPYEVLDCLEESLMELRLDPDNAYRRLIELFADLHGPQQLRTWTAKFCRLFTQAQWKRERYAPAFHLDDRNLDPKTWARFPILSGSFQAELAEMEAGANEDEPGS